jgi:hypothetical protein
MFSSEGQPQLWYRLAAIVFLTLSALLFTRSKVALAPAVRYRLPLIPPVAVLLGLLT